MKRNIAFLTAGILLGTLAGWRVPKQTNTQRPNDDSKSSHHHPESWLFPREVTLADIFSEPLALEILRAPERITLHKFGKRDLTVSGFAFDATPNTPGESDAEALLTCLRSLNAYTPPSACAFEPGVLIRLEKGGHRLDLLVCFKCSDMARLLDLKSTSGGAGIGISDIGISSLKTIFHRVWPEDPFFHAP